MDTEWGPLVWWGWILIALGVVGALVVLGWLIRRFWIPGRSVFVPVRDPILGPLEDAIAAFQALGSPVDLELPEPEVEITQGWVVGIRQTAEYVAERQQKAIAHRGQRRAALRALRQIRRGVERVTSTEEQAVEEAHVINAVAEGLGMEPLEIVSEEDHNAALNALRRANDRAEGTV